MGIGGTVGTLLGIALAIHRTRQKIELLHQKWDVRLPAHRTQLQKDLREILDSMRPLFKLFQRRA